MTAAETYIMGRVTHIEDDPRGDRTWGRRTGKNSLSTMWEQTELIEKTTGRED